MTYEALYSWAGSWGLLILVIFFTIAVIYALWPANRDKFERAADMPLMDDDMAGFHSVQSDMRPNTQEGRS